MFVGVELLEQLEEVADVPFQICSLRTRLLRQEDNGRQTSSLASVFVDTFAASLIQFEKRLYANTANLSTLPETKRLCRLLDLHAKFCQYDDILAEEVGREGSHLYLLRIIQFPISDDDHQISEADQDMVMEMQDRACSIAATYDTFPMRCTPLTFEEFQQRLPIKFDVDPISLDESKVDGTTRTESILIHQVTKRQSAQEDVGFVMWPSAVVLARWIATNAPVFQASKSVLEIGAGCGLAGLLAARLQQKWQTKRKGQLGTNTLNGEFSVTLSDFNPCVLENLKRNIAINNLSDICTIKGLDFFDQPGLATLTDDSEQGWVDTDKVLQKPVDIVLGADIICQPSDAAAASRAIYNALKPGGCSYIVCATSAHRFGVEVFPSECARMGLNITSYNVASLYDGSLLNYGLEHTTGYVDGMAMIMFTIEKPLQ
ncbi:hypothetical protein ACA910_005245 [Epithemia clementina (nom. ined.)]